MEPVERIKIEIVLARDARHVRPEETAADEERSVLMLLQELDATVGDLGVGVVGTVPIGLEPAERSAQRACRGEIGEANDVLFFVFVAPSWIDDLIP